MEALPVNSVRKKIAKSVLLAVMFWGLGLSNIYASVLQIMVPLSGMTINPGGETSIGEVSLSSRPISMRISPNLSCIAVPTDKVQLQVKALLENGIEIDITNSPYTSYSSSDTGVVAVSSYGLVTVTGVGRTEIRVEYLLAVGYAEIIADPALSITDIRPLFGVEMSDEMLPEETAPSSSITIAPGDVSQLSVLAQLSSGKSCYLTGNISTIYSSENSQIVSVDGVGRVTSQNLGAARINIQAAGISTSTIVYVKERDVVPPVTGISFSSPNYISPTGTVYLSTCALVYLSPVDPAVDGAYTSGISFTGIAIDEIPQSEAGFWRYIPFDVNPGKHTLNFLSWDNAGNTEVVKSSVVYVDALAPSVDYEITGSSSASGDMLILSTSSTIGFVGADSGSGDSVSGLSRIMYSVDVAFSSDTAGLFYEPFVLSTGAHVVYYAAFDNVDNQSELKVLRVLVGSFNTNVACGGVITENTLLTADLDCSGVTGTAVTIGADNITFDGGGHKIIAPNASVVIAGQGVRNVTIKNIAISSGTAGRGAAVTATRSLFENISVHGREFGLIVSGGDNVVQGNDLSGNSRAALRVSGYGGQVRNNDLQNSGVGLALYSASNTVVASDNRVAGSQTGVDVSYCSDLNIGGLVLDNQYAITGAYSAKLRIHDLVLSSGVAPGGRGLDMSLSVNDSVFENITVHGREYGMIVGGNGNVIQDNNLSRNPGTSLQVRGGGVTILRNDLSDSGTALSLYVASGTPVLLDNKLSGSQTGIWISYSNDLTIENQTLDNRFAIAGAYNNRVHMRNLVLSSSGTAGGRGLDMSLSVNDSVFENITVHGREYGMIIGGIGNVIQDNNLSRNPGTSLQVRGWGATVLRNELSDSGTALSLYVASGTPVLVENNMSGSQTGIGISYSNDVTIENLTLDNKFAITGAYNTGLRMQNLVLSSSGTAGGRGLDMSLSVNDSVFENITVHGREYGMIVGGNGNVMRDNDLSRNSGTSLQVRGWGSVVSKNDLSDSGTALSLYLASGTHISADNKFVGSQTGIYISYSNNLNVEGLSLDNQYGIAGSNNRDLLLRGIALSNGSVLGGRGIDMSDSSGLQISNLLVYGKDVAVNLSGTCSNVAFVSDTIYGNNRGIVLGAGTSGTSVINSILWGNQDDIEDLSGAAVVSYSNTEESMPSRMGNTQVAPMFIDASAGDFRLAPLSPCVDVGTNSVVGLPEKDILGNPRVFDGNGDGLAVVDMGAYESQELGLRENLSGDGLASITTPGVEIVVSAISTTTITSSMTVFTAMIGAGLEPVQGSLYEFEPSGVQFAVPATLRFAFDPVGVDTTTLAIYYFDGVAWSSAAVANQRVVIETSTSAYLEGEISHTSMYALLRKKAETAYVVGVVFSPSTLNLDSRGGYITADLSFVSGTGCFRPETVAISAVNGAVLDEPVYAQRPGGGKRRGVYELQCGSATLKFDREAVAALLPANAVVTLTVSGTLDGGAAFSAEDAVRTIKHFKATRRDKWHYSHKCGAHLDGKAGSLREDRDLFMLKVERDLAWKEAQKDRAARVAGFKRHGAAFEFGPEGLKFETSVTVGLPYDAAVKNPERLAVAYWNEKTSAWERLASRVDRSGRFVKADVEHFSQYQVVEATMTVSAPEENKVVRVREEDTVQAAASQEFRLGEVYVYPDPAKGGKVPVFHVEVGMADTVKIRVYTVAGQLAHEAALSGAPQAIGGGYAYEYQWAGRIASGVYYYTVEAERGGKKLKTRGKFAVVR